MRTVSGLKAKYLAAPLWGNSVLDEADRAQIDELLNHKGRLPPLPHFPEWADPNRLDQDPPECVNCGATLSDLKYWYEDRPLCPSCDPETYRGCEFCDLEARTRELIGVPLDEIEMCSDCRWKRSKNWVIVTCSVGCRCRFLHPGPWPTYHCGSRGCHPDMPEPPPVNYDDVEPF